MHSLDSTAHREHAELLAREGLLERTGQQAARLWIRARIDWLGWLDDLLLGIGALLVLAGVGVFLTYHWFDMPRLVRLAAVEATLAAGVAGTWWLGLDSRHGKVLLTACSVMVGVLLAVYESSYRTVDEINLIVLWAALIAGWVAIGRFLPLWGLEIFLFNWAVSDWLSRHHVLPRTSFEAIVLGVLNGSFMIAGEWGRRRGLEWLQGRWYRLALWVVTVWLFSVPATWLATWRGATSCEVVGSLIWLALLVGGYRQFRRVTPDVTGLAVGAASVGCVAECLLMYWLFDGRPGNMHTWLLAALCSVTITGALGAWLRAVARDIEEDSRE